MGTRTECLTLITEQETQEDDDIIFMNEYLDRRYVFKKPDPKCPHVRRTAYQGVNRYGEWIELMEVTEERYKGQMPFYTIAVTVPAEQKGSPVMKKYSYGDPLSGWEEGYYSYLTGDIREAREDLEEMDAPAGCPEKLPEQIDIEATSHAFFDQIEQNVFSTPPLFRLDYTPDR